MRSRLTLLAAVALTASAFALNTGNSLPDKTATFDVPSAPDPATIRQGGDTIADAVVIPALPYETTGTTTGFTDDYDEVCPYSGSTAPDVVYSLTPPADIAVDIDMLGSTYDTKIYLYDADLNLVACNDDFYPDYVSKLEQIDLVGGALYYLVIDGWNGDFGDYVLAITEYVPCVLECPPGGHPEGEPPLVDEYEDAYNGGCNSPEFGTPFQHLYGDENGELVFCGVSGWYQYQGGNRRDTDWFVVHAGSVGVIEIVGNAERTTILQEIRLQDCGSLAWIPPIVVGPCATDAISIETPVGGSIWYWAGPDRFSGPNGVHPFEYDYVVHFSGLEPAPVAVEIVTWSSVKALFQ